MSDIVDKLLYFPAEGEAEQIMDEAKAEIERLREELLSRHAEIRRQAEEIERLRGLLREALTGETHGEWMMRVREALGE